MIGATPPSSICTGASRRGIRPEPVRVCAPVPGKPYFSVDGRKPFTRKSSRWLCEFAPHSRESLISPSRGANLSPGRAPGGCGSLRLPPGKALFFRREAQTVRPEKPPVAVRVCASLPGKPYSSVERRKPFTRKSPRRLREFAPHSRESLISPSRGANPSPGRAHAVCGSLRLTPGKALFLRREAQTLRRGIRPEPVRVCAPVPGKPVMK